MMLTGADALRQNTAGYSEGRPVGVPTSYDWYDGVVQPAAAAPAGFTSVTAWGQVYQEVGETAYANPQAMVEVANAMTYVHLRETGEWVLVQNQVSTPIAGGNYVADFAGNSAEAMSVSTGSDGRAAFAAPPDGYNNHFWPSERGHYPANAVDAVYVQMDMRVNDPNLNLVANVGADWWRDASAPFVAGFGNNPGAGMNNWTELTTQWKTLAFTSSNVVLAADPPPPLVRTEVEVPSIVKSPPGGGMLVAIGGHRSRNEGGPVDGTPDLLALVALVALAAILGRRAKPAVWRIPHPTVLRSTQA